MSNFGCWDGPFGLNPAIRVVFPVSVVPSDWPQAGFNGGPGISHSHTFFTPVI